MSHRLRPFILLAAFCTVTGVARADTFAVYPLQGTLVTGGTIGGSFTVDTTLAEVTGVAFTVQDGGATYAVDTLIGADPTPGDYQIVAESADTAAYAELFLPTTTLAGYEGSALCSETNGCGFFGDESYLTLSSLSFEDFVTDGTVGPGVSTAVTPEPGSLWLFATGAAGMCAAVRRRIRA